MSHEESLTDLIARETSLRARVGYTALLVAGGGMAALVAALWATEPELPLRTHVAFGAIVLIGLGWAGLAGWVLAKKKPLFAVDRIIAASIALAASTVFTGGSAWIAAAGPDGSPLVAVLLLGAVAIGASTVLLGMAVRRRRDLVRRLAELEG